MSKITKEKSKAPRINSAKTLIERAKHDVPRFKEHIAKFEEQIVIGGYSPSTLFSYSRSIASISLHFGKSPIELDMHEIDSYLYELTKRDTPSATYFKHLVYGLRFLFRLYDLEDKLIKLPSIKQKRKLPVVFSKQEVKVLLKAPARLKQRVMLALIYSAGLRISELCELNVSDIDSDRMQIRIKQSKGNKDRYVILSEYLVKGLRKYYLSSKPKQYLFFGRDKNKPISKTAIRSSFHLAVKKAGIKKDCCVHTLRHSFATHLLEDGMDIITIKELLGHSHISTTMEYLHVAKLDRTTAHSPLDTLYNKKI